MLLMLLTICITSILLTQAKEKAVVLNQVAIDAFLKAHNDERANHSLLPLVWDQTLSDYAGKWSANCKWEHSEGIYGENLYSSSAKSDNVDSAKHAVKAWNSCMARHTVIGLWHHPLQIGQNVDHLCGVGNYVGEKPY
ncbi:fruiting body protein sc7 precursor [Bulinus truncatus]|nr:fruiting body protein sc7 precursor [Bulinus truncatus]